MDEEKLKLNLGIKIKEYRNKKNLTQEEFSEHIGITQRQVSLIEIGKSYPNPNTLSKIVNFLDLSLSDLFNFEYIGNIDNQKKELIKIIENLPADKLKIIYIISKNI